MVMVRGIDVSYQSIAPSGATVTHAKLERSK